jgi:hypothetical protein
MDYGFVKKIEIYLLFLIVYRSSVNLIAVNSLIKVNGMDIGNMLGDSFEYTKEAIVGKWMQWLLLVIATILLCIPLLGYSLKVFRGEKPAPEITGWGTLFIDGIKYVIVALIWAIPALIIFFVTISAGIMALFGYPAAMYAGSMALSVDPASVMRAIVPILFGLILFLIVAIITFLFATIGIIRFARTGSMGEAFNFREISVTIGKIGWGSYILSLVVLIVVMIIIEIVSSILGSIPVLGIIIELVLIAPITLFESRYLCQVYDAASG